MATSFFRSAYELLFTPLPPKEKRASKSLIDVGADRLGDVLGGSFIALVLFAVPSVLEPVLIVTALLAAAFAIAITLRLHRGYVETLERNLLARAVTLDARDASDRTTRQALMHTMTVMDVPIASRRASSTAVEPRASEPQELDPVARDVAALRSGSAERVIGVLRAAPLGDESVTSAIPLLAWDLVAADVTAALRNVAARHVGQLSDALLHPDNDFAIRRRVARVLSVVDSQRAVDALFLGLADRRFEVRRNCGHALATIHARRAEGLSFPADRVEAAVLNEATVSRRVWDGRRLLDDIDEEGIPFTDPALVERSNRSLEHVFTLLGLMLPTQPLVVAYRGLHTTDAALKGTALEYLESVLPPAVRSALWPYLEVPAKPKAASTRTQAQILDDLIRSNHSIQLNLEEIRRRLR